MSVSEDDQGILADPNTGISRRKTQLTDVVNVVSLPTHVSFSEGNPIS
jgi:hypothetical protein